MINKLLILIQESLRNRNGETLSMVLVDPEAIDGLKKLGLVNKNTAILDVSTEDETENISLINLTLDNSIKIVLGYNRETNYFINVDTKEPIERFGKVELE